MYYVGSSLSKSIFPFDKLTTQKLSSPKRTIQKQILTNSTLFKKTTFANTASGPDEAEENSDSDGTTPGTTSFYVENPQPYYVTYVSVPTYEIDHDKESGAVEGAPAPIMASVAVEDPASHGHAHFHVRPAHGVGGAEPIFTSSDLPLQPYPHLSPPAPPIPPGAGTPTAPPPGSGPGAGIPHNDLFVNPAFAHMSFLSDGSMVGPSGEIYSPAEYFPSLLVEHSQEVPAVIPVSPQPGEYPPPGTCTPPPGVGKNSDL